MPLYVRARQDPLSHLFGWLVRLVICIRGGRVGRRSLVVVNAAGVLRDVRKPPNGVRIIIRCTRCRRPSCSSLLPA